MKTMKKALAILLTVLMVLSMAVSVSAADAEAPTDTLAGSGFIDKDSETCSIVITNSESGHTYEAYRIFAGDYNNGILTNITWGDGVDESGLIAALQAWELSTSVMPFASCADAAAVAEVLSGAAFSTPTNRENLDKFAEFMERHLSATPTKTSTPGGTDPNYTYTINGLKPGYYMIKDEDDSLSGNTSYTKLMLQVLGATTITAKADKPTVDKVIVDGGDVKANNASVGDTVRFKITSTVPAMNGYESYAFVITDTPSTGLDAKDAVNVVRNLVVKVGNETLTRVDTIPEDDTAYKASTEGYHVAWDGTSFVITFINFIQYKDNVNRAIEITYDAIITKDAIIGDDGNPNEVNLKYSNDPNDSHDGIPETPEGITPSSYTMTYVTGVNIKKVDKNDVVKTLAGAEFDLEGTTLNKVVVVKDVFTLDDESGTYYPLTDGTYTTTAPTAATAGSYVGGMSAQTYTLTQSAKTEVEASASKVHFTVRNDGTYDIDGLEQGVYKLTETKAPSGYNKLDAPIYFAIVCLEPTGTVTNTSECEWWFKKSDTEITADSLEPLTTVGALTAAGYTKIETGATDAQFEIQVQNSTGSELPETGGIGTTIFYIIGGAMMFVAVVLLVTKKKMASKK